VQEEAPPDNLPIPWNAAAREDARLEAVEEEEDDEHSLRLHHCPMRGCLPIPVEPVVFRAELNAHGKVSRAAALATVAVVAHALRNSLPLTSACPNE